MKSSIALFIFQKEVKTRISYIVDALGKMEEVLKKQAELDARQAAKKEQETTRRVRKISGSESGSDRGGGGDKADKRESSVKKTSKKKRKKVKTFPHDALYHKKVMSPNI